MELLDRVGDEPPRDGDEIDRAACTQAGRQPSPRITVLMLATLVWQNTGALWPVERSP